MCYLHFITQEAEVCAHVYVCVRWSYHAAHNTGASITEKTLNKKQCVESVCGIKYTFITYSHHINRAVSVKHTHTHTPVFLAHHQRVFIHELVIRNLQVERSRTFPDAARGVVVRAMTWAIVPSEVTCVGNRNTAQVSAHPDDDYPGGFLDAVAVVLRVTQLRQVHLGLGGNLLLSAVTHEQRLPSPLKSHVLALGDVRQLDLDFGQGQHVGRSTHGGDELRDGCFGSVHPHYGSGARDQVGEHSPHISALLRRLLWVHHLRTSIIREIRNPNIRVGETHASARYNTK